MRHGQPVNGIAGGAGPMPGLAGGNHQQQIEAKLFQRRLGNCQMSHMRRIKGAAEDSDALGWLALRRHRTNGGRGQTQSRRGKKRS